ncbi:hypothetical protein [Methanolapillus millepedarum]|uniref:Uncharacterized protein n=1 Tax=Methanolapillus millepedarum TaxID=3028296 RepID=A0AA96ZTW0_9EURY|nr:hypothetical protein MsAc7_04630 [Methanosarcinaceae archaeon Ac7]
MKYNPTNQNNSFLFLFLFVTSSICIFFCYAGLLSGSILPAIPAAILYIFGSLIFGFLSKDKKKAVFFGVIYSIPYLYVFRESNIWFVAFLIPIIQGSIGYFSAKDESDFDMKGFYYLILVFLMGVLMFLPLIYFK